MARSKSKESKEITRESLVADLLANLKDAQERGNLAQANRALQILQGLLREDDAQREALTPEVFLAELDDVLFNDDLIREHLRRRLAVYDASHEGGEPLAGGEATSLDLLHGPTASILFPEGHEIPR